MIVRPTTRCFQTQGLLASGRFSFDFRVAAAGRADAQSQQAFGAFFQREFHALAFLERFETLHFNGRKVGKGVRAAAIRLNEAKAFLIVEPFDGAVGLTQHIVRHVITPFLDEVAAVYGPILELIFLMSSVNTVYYVFFLKISGLACMAWFYDHLEQAASGPCADRMTSHGFASLLPSP